jgi:hypothetical protein
LQFLGRRDIPGLHIGSKIEAEGMVGEKNKQLVMLNPEYTISL